MDGRPVPSAPSILRSDIIMWRIILLKAIFQGAVSCLVKFLIRGFKGCGFAVDSGSFPFRGRFDLVFLSFFLALTRRSEPDQQSNEQEDGAVHTGLIKNNEIGNFNILLFSGNLCLPDDRNQCICLQGGIFWQGVHFIGAWSQIFEFPCSVKTGLDPIAVIPVVAVNNINPDTRPVIGFLETILFGKRIGISHNRQNMNIIEYPTSLRISYNRHRKECPRPKEIIELSLFAWLIHAACPPMNKSLLPKDLGRSRDVRRWSDEQTGRHHVSRCLATRSRPHSGGLFTSRE